MQEKFGSGGLRILAVNAWNEPAKQVKDFIAEHNLPYTVLLNGAEVFNGPYNGKYVPQSYLIDPEGKIRYTQLGWGDGSEEELSKKIEDLLADTP